MGEVVAFGGCGFARFFAIWNLVEFSFAQDLFRTEFRMLREF